MPDVMKTVGRYEILREVGRGGMATVYLARQTDLDRFVALKELGAFHASDPSFAQRFLRESRVAGSLSHPNIVTVHDYFEHDGTPYIAMEFVERGSLRPYVGRMTLAQVGGVLEGLLAGLAHGEQHGIVHRDLKPENLMVTADGRVKIADFGIAKATTKMQTGAYLTATGTTVGTPTYMAPEQAMAQDIGPWTDLYSVGCMAFELFTGRVPFHDSDAPMAILLRHVNEPIPPVTSLEPAVDPRISHWIEGLLVKDPKQRTGAAADAWEDFEEIVIALLGPRWRREARLSQRAATVDTPKPLTPAPFEGTSAEAAPSDEFQSFAWGAPSPDTGEAASAPPGPFTPPPQPQAPAPPEPEVGLPTPEPTPAVEDGGFVTFGAPAPPPPTDALVPPPVASPEPEPAAPPPAAAPEATDGFDTYVEPPQGRPPAEPDDEPAPPPPAEAPPPAGAVAATAMPRTPPPAEERAPAPATEPEERRNLFPFVLVAGAVLAAAIGFLLGGSGGEEPPAAEPVAASAGNVALELPAGWTRAATAPDVPGLALDEPAAFASGEQSVVLGVTEAENPSLLPRGVLQAAGGVPGQRAAVRLGPQEAEAFRYELDGGVTLFAAPTTEGVATLACVEAPDCDAIASTLRITRGEPLPVGPSQEYAEAVGAALRDLSRAADRATRALEGARTPAAQARAARDLRGAYREASRAVGNLEPSPADRGVNARLATALSGVAAAYERAAAAAGDNSARGFRRAGAAVQDARREVAAAFDGLRAAGYEIEA